MIKRLSFWILLWLLVLLSFSAVNAEEQKWCPLCSMNLKMFWKTTHWLTFSDGTRIGYCSLHCVSEVYAKRATEIDYWEAVDYDTKKLVDAHKAHFLIGSDLPGTMTAISKLAFASLDVAEKYQKDHGGTIGSLDQALKQALEDRGEDATLIKKKMIEMIAMGRKLSQKLGCYRCHGEEGTGGAAPGWKTEEFAKRMDSRVKIKEKILTGTQGMEGYRGKITERELHGLAIFVWTRRDE